MSIEQTPSWELYGAFLAVMREGSFSAAARALRVAQPTIRRRIAALEEALGHALFSRSPNGLTPTDTARSVMPLVEEMEATSRAVVRAVSADPDRVHGVVRIAASQLVGAEVLPGLLRGLRDDHPELSIELVLSNRIADVTRREADIAVRMAPPTGASLVARRIGSITLGFYAAPSYLAGRSPPRELSDLLQHDLVGYDTDPQLLEGLGQLGLAVRPRDFAFRTDDDLAYLGAIRAGHGIGVTYGALSTQPPLVRVLPHLGLPIDLWLVAHEDLKKVRRIRVAIEHLAEALADTVDPGRVSLPPPATERPARGPADGEVAAQG